MSLKTVGGRFISSAGKILTDICACICDNTVHSPCNGSDRVKKTLTLTFNWHGITHNFTLTWITSSSSCFNQEGWDTPIEDVVICADASPTFSIRQWALCCDGVSWQLTLAYVLDGILQSATTPSGGIDAITVVSTSPMHLTTTIPGLDVCGLGADDALIDIQ